MIAMLRALIRAISRWWVQDRIRVARGEGKLFRVLVGDRLIIDDEILVVIARTDQVNAGKPQIMLTLSQDGAGYLSDPWSITYTNQWGGVRYTLGENGARVNSAAHAPLPPGDQVILRRDGVVFELRPDQVSLLAGRPPRNSKFL